MRIVYGREKVFGVGFGLDYYFSPEKIFIIVFLWWTLEIHFGKKLSK